MKKSDILFCLNLALIVLVAILIWRAWNPHRPADTKTEDLRIELDHFEAYIQHLPELYEVEGYDFEDYDFTDLQGHPVDMAEKMTESVRLMVLVSSHQCQECVENVLSLFPLLNETIGPDKVVLLVEGLHQKGVAVFLERNKFTNQAYFINHKPSTTESSDPIEDLSRPIFFIASNNLAIQYPFMPLPQYESVTTSYIDILNEKFHL
ncbi:MAG: hypothetical protein LIP03_10400 [Bacteroidales bacterium]|nr:hypothetical protein [Bacteroidales bacterium]